MIASLRDRSTWTLARDCSLVIHCEEPSDAAARPSKVPAVFSVMCGVRVRCQCSHGRSTPSEMSSDNTPVRTSRPFDRSHSAPPDATGFGSATPYTTCRTPDSHTAPVHGGVFPWWWHGSRVTTTVPPAALAPAIASACGSACGPPGGSVPAMPTGIPARSNTTHPTGGLGRVVPRTRSAAAIARRIAWSTLNDPPGIISGKVGTTCLRSSRVRSQWHEAPQWLRPGTRHRTQQSLRQRHHNRLQRRRRWWPQRFHRRFR